MTSRQQPGESDNRHSEAPSDEPGGSDVPSTSESIALSRDSEAASSALLLSSSFALCIAGLYAALSSLSWILTVYITFRPITSPNLRYGSTYLANGDGLTIDQEDRRFEQNENWFQAARVLTSVVGVFSIPAASAICASAAAVFSQRRAKSKRTEMTIRQVMMLADRNWTNPFTYMRALTLTGWRQYGSSFLAVAICVHILGFIIAPLQQIFLSSKTIKRSQIPESVDKLFDISTHLRQNPLYDGQTNNTVVLATRNALERASVTQPQTQLWPGGDVVCSGIGYDGCSEKMSTFTDFSLYPSPFFAQLPNGFNTGLIRQYIPRINSTTTVVSTDFPGNCGDTSGSLLFHYEHPGSPYDNPWAVTACMPADMRRSPWRVTRDRQDFSEELYINITYRGPSAIEERPGEYVFKITVNTTAGYFELPNYSNGGRAGPLSEKAPICTGSNDCFWYQFKFIDTALSDEALYLDSHKGPLHTLTLALFGPDSFFETWPHLAREPSFESSSEDEETCLSMPPLGGLLLNNFGSLYMRNLAPRQSASSDEFPCAFTRDETAEEAIYNWLDSFCDVSLPTLENAFNAASFLTNQAWVEFGNDDPALRVNWDMGKDTLVPTFSVGGIVTVSVLLGLYLFMLLWIGYYSAHAPRWTEQLDSFAMMRIGASVADDVPLLAARDPSCVAVLDKIPGVMGDSVAENERIGMLALGGPVPLNSKRLYISYRKGV